MDSIRDKQFYVFLHRQIPIFIFLSLLPGLGYLFLGWLNGILMPALIWYLLVIVASLFGYRLYRNFDFDSMGDKARNHWYRLCSWFFYAFFMLWVGIFLAYVGHADAKLHYIAIFTEIGASVVASTLLSSDRKLYMPTIYILMVPLIIYFFLIGEWYSYVLSAFACTLTWVLLHAAKSSNQLLMQSNHQANHDALTGLYNRRYFIGHLQQKLNSLKDTREFSYIQLIDLDHFKNVNDSLGHDVGDLLIQSVTARLSQYIPSGGIVSRLGGDEFIITGGDYSSREECERTAIAISEELIAMLKEPYVIDQHHFYISASIGVSIISGRDIDAGIFIKEADIAMYEVKDRGRDGVFVFNDEISLRVEKSLEIEHQLHAAIENHEISQHYQPQFDREGRIIGAEALARWNSPSLGNIPPEQFIPIAEQTGLIITLGYQIIESGFKTIREWRDKGIRLDQFSINISIRQFTHQQFVPQIEELIQRHLDEELCSKIMFEITESIMAEDINRVIATINILKQRGIRFSLDDFGTGYSSLSYLSRIPLDEIKIDRSFVHALDNSDGGKAMIVSILNMARIFNLKIVAEGVETVAQSDFLMEMDTHFFQGYLYSKALSKENFEDYYRNAA